ncbi:hypothetical protein DQ04_13761000 [Trypanosoma grayi]|uniref:hypothetical protein n=1 Tax=Trypanosoma grayi TaxID=71804 RepID=UPI0004F4A231|nr:hypothetical protein DQ04_13761000 [Trypanosoma grayi]KEG06470.1 hypothetical protein DQ04_13761000 [Trypanosoma grayi]
MGCVAVALQAVSLLTGAARCACIAAAGPSPRTPYSSTHRNSLNVIEPVRSGSMTCPTHASKLASTWKLCSMRLKSVRRTVPLPSAPPPNSAKARRSSM